MYLLGICRGGPAGGAELVLIRRERRGIDKLYRLIAAEAHDHGTPDAILADRIAGYYQRQDLVTTRTRFSQVGRPRKRIRRRPVVLVDESAGATLPALLRQRQVRHHTIQRTPSGPGWRVSWRPGQQGGVFQVPVDELLACILRVRDERRIVLATDDRPQGPALPWAAEVCIWYEENLPAIRQRQPAATVLAD